MNLRSCRSPVCQEMFDTFVGDFPTWRSSGEVCLGDVPGGRSGMVLGVCIRRTTGVPIPCVVASGYEMSCYHPIEVGILRKPLYGGFRRRDPQVVGCGSCIGCRADQARDWMIRIMHERALHVSAWFLTLTYSDKELPEHGSLRSTDLQRFFKALRRRIKAHEVLRYFACGEYGGQTKRAHYHAVLLGPDFLDRVLVSPPGAPAVWRSEAIASAWPVGIHELGSLTTGGAAYVAGYVTKKLKAREMDDNAFFTDPWTGEVLREKPFSRMSLRPAIGNHWLRKYWRDVYPRDFVAVNGREYRPPRYYDKWMDMEHDDAPVLDKHGNVVVPACGDCAEHQRVMVEVREKRYEELEDVSDYELHAREVAHISRAELFERRVGV